MKGSIIIRYTIKDIAKELGVSITTVSLIINNQPCRVSEKTRKAVLDTVKKYNYIPNSSARALITKKTFTVGLIVPDISNPFFSELAKGVERAAQEEEYSVIFCNSNDSAQKDLKNAALLNSKQIDGLIIAPSISNQNIDEINSFKSMMKQHRIPTIVIDRKIPYSTFSSVSSDHREGGFRATNHLIELGHQEIACITGPLDVDSAQNRYQGYLDALQVAGLKSDEKMVFSGDYKIATGYDGMKELMKNKLTAVFACNDLIALGVMQYIREKNLVPGKDISIIGYDDIPICEMLDYPLTTVNQALYEMGKSAFKLILSHIEHPREEIDNISLIPSVIVRKTTGKLVV